MRYSNDFGVYEIFVESAKDEKEQEVLRAIAEASFELAMGEFGIQPKISPKEKETLINQAVKLSDRSGDAVLSMNEAAGRWCSTYVERVSKDHFRLSNAFQQFRGTPVPMLELARKLLNAGVTQR